MKRILILAMRNAKLVLISTLIVLAVQVSAQTAASALTASVFADPKVSDKVKECVKVSTSAKTTTVELYLSPVNYKDSAGEWKPVDEKFVAASESKDLVASPEQKVPMTVSKDGSRRYAIATDVFFSIGAMEQDLQDDGKWSQLIPANTEISDNLVIFDYKESGVVKLVNMAQESKFYWTISDEKSVHTTRWLLDGSSEVTFELDDFKGVKVFDRDKQVSYIAPMYVVQEGEFPVNNPVEVSLDHNYLIIKRFPEVSAFPIVIDPTVVYSTQPTPGQDTWTQYDAPTNNYGANTQLLMGYPTAASTWKRQTTLIKFDLTVLAGSTINSATFYCYNDENAWRDRGNITARRILAANTGWVAGTADGTPQAGSVSWSSHSYTTKAWAGSTGGCQVSGTDFSSVGLGTATIGNVNWPGGETITMALNLTEFNTMVTTNDGIVLYNYSDSNFRAGSGNNATAARRPRLDVTYTTTAVAGYNNLRVIQTE
jgi:hypothetical protein